jgi:SpoVK/Ycf46/Vps4 family AAA+-type ATPase
MSSIRSKWWGEDEKNIKSIFNNYKSILQDSKIEPILLLNEADAIIGKRLDVSGNNGAIISSINATQNIILDAFDEFEGILIATTNLTKNFDSAFERRFLYKIEFEKPNLETRSKIFESMLKIPEEDAHIIANQFELSGGNIENIYRKMTTRKILYGEEYSLDRIIDLCKDEKIEKDLPRIGFGN